MEPESENPAEFDSKESTVKNEAAPTPESENMVSEAEKTPSASVKNSPQHSEGKETAELEVNEESTKPDSEPDQAPDSEVRHQEKSKTVEDKKGSDVDREPEPAKAASPELKAEIKSDEIEVKSCETPKIEVVESADNSGDNSDKNSEKSEVKSSTESSPNKEVEAEVEKSESEVESEASVQSPEKTPASPQTTPSPKREDGLTTKSPPPVEEPGKLSPQQAAPTVTRYCKTAKLVVYC